MYGVITIYVPYMSRTNAKFARITFDHVNVRLVIALAMIRARRRSRLERYYYSFGGA